MKMEVIRILLEEVYDTKDSNLKKCGVLIEKAKSLRAYRSACVEECIQCLSDAISALVSYMLLLIVNIYMIRYSSFSDVNIFKNRN